MKTKSLHSRITNKKALDGFTNIAKGIGGNKDTLQNTGFNRISLDLSRNYYLASELYQFNWLVGNIADIPAEEATREWCSFKTSNNQDNLKTILNLLDTLELKQNITKALAFADLFGGSALYVVVNDGNSQDKPLNYNTIKPKSFKKIRVLEPSHLTPETNGLIEPQYYNLLGSDGEYLKIHKSRLFFFKGLETTDQKEKELNYWGASKVQRSLEPIIGSDTAINAIVNMLTEHNVNVYKLEGLTELAIDDQDDDAIKRIQIIDTMKSYLNALVLDSKDDFIKRQNDFKDLHQIDMSTLIRVAGSAQIPATLLFGKSPDGQNATGASDFKAFYNRIKKVQTNRIDPKLKIILKIASLSELQKDITPDITNTWLPLEQETLKERADREKTDSETITNYKADGLITEQEARRAIKENDSKFSFLEVEKEQKEEVSNEK